MNHYDAGMRLEKPPHPGGFVKAEVIEPLNLSVTNAAEALGITRAALSTFLNGRSNLSREMALRIERAFGVPMDTLMRLQWGHDIAEARFNEGEIGVKRYVQKAKSRVQPGIFEG